MKKNADIVLIGAGIMSATLGVMLKELMPDSHITIYERLDRIGAESSDAWNNAGTGHSAFCELNYTPYDAAGDLDISKALKIAESFEVSKQFWAYLKELDRVPTDVPFINDIPHMSFVMGEQNIDFLHDRFNSMTPYPIFEDMRYSTDWEVMTEWMPLIMEGRDRAEHVAATRMDIGTDVNFGAITRAMIAYLETCDHVDVILGHEVDDLTLLDDGRWQIDLRRMSDCQESVDMADFVFIGAGGGAIPLLEKSDLEEAKGYAGFPVSGMWLRCNNPEVIAQHEAKVYGKAAVGSPPMSVPHLDTRMMTGEKSLLFGPYAGFSTKFLKEGSYMDLPLSLEIHNIWPMVTAGVKNVHLTKYLIEQVFQSKNDRFEFLQLYFPEARSEDWELEIAGQRVQIIKRNKKGGGELKFGTEIVTDDAGSLAALLGASPGASTAVSIMLDLLSQCWPDEMQTAEWQQKIKAMIPSYGQSLISDGELCRVTRARTTEILGLHPAG